MSPNQIFVRNLVLTFTAISAITTIALWLGAASRHREQPTSTPRVTADKPRSLIELGARLYESKGCVACHTIDGSPRVGPSFKDSWGAPVELADGITLVFDESYVRESLTSPQAKARPGYPPSMPSYDGLLTPKEADALIAFMRSLASTERADTRTR